MHSNDPVVEAVCRLPVDFRSLGNVSPVELVRRSGYMSMRASATADHLADCLASRPDLIDAWFGWSEDRRSSPAWWLASAGPSEYQVGYYDPTVEPQAPPLMFRTRLAACAEYVHRELEAIADTVAQVEAGRDAGESDLDAAIRLAQQDDRR